MGKVIDLDEGYYIRVHPATGAEVYMKATEPGVYLNAHGDEVSPKFAADAGFNVDAEIREKERRQKVAAATAEIDKLYSGAVEAAVVDERKGYQLVDIGHDRFVIKDPEGNQLTPNPVSKAVATIVFDQLVPGEVKAPEQKGPPAPAPKP